MRLAWLSFMQMIKYMKKDKMLFVVCLAPLLIGLVFRFVIPFLETELTKWLNMSSVLSGYYKLFDIFFSMLSPTLFCFVSSMVCLEENDEKTASYLFITPLGKKGYLFSRLGISSLVAFLLTAIIFPFVKLTTFSTSEIVLLIIIGSIQGFIISLMILSFSKNKLEGMAISKLSSIFMLGGIVPFLINADLKYVFSFLPSFWMALAVYNDQLVFMIVAFALSIVWLLGLLMRYIKRL